MEYIYFTHLKLEECKRRLKILESHRYQYGKMWGKIRGNNTFYIIKPKKFARHSFMRILAGRLFEDSEGTIISFKYRRVRFVQIFTLYLFINFVFICITIFKSIFLDMYNQHSYLDISYIIV